MLKFKKPEITDKQWVDEILSKSASRNCEFCFGNIFIWADEYNTEIAEYDGFLIMRSFIDNEYSYAFSFSDGNIPAVVCALKEDADRFSQNLKLYGITDDEKSALEKVLSDKFLFSAERKYFEYVYLTSDLISLDGRKYHQKRNHLSYFRNNYNWSYEKMTEQNIEDCRRYNKQWENDNQDKSPAELAAESVAINKAFDNYQQLGFVGGVIRIDGNVAAYTMGERLNDNTFCTHFEKADADTRGAYPIINQQFAENELSSYKYINREDDTGSEGLRKAKLSYHPNHLISRYAAVYQP